MRKILIYIASIFWAAERRVQLLPVLPALLNLCTFIVWMMYMLVDGFSTNEDEFVSMIDSVTHFKTIKRIACGKERAL